MEENVVEQKEKETQQVQQLAFYLIVTITLSLPQWQRSYIPEPLTLPEGIGQLQSTQKEKQKFPDLYIGSNERDVEHTEGSIKIKQLIYGSNCVA